MTDKIKFAHKAEFEYDSIDKYVSDFFDQLALLKNDFIDKNQQLPEVLFIDWMNYKKFELAYLRSKYNTFSLYADDNNIPEFESRKSTLMGIDFEVVPISEKLFKLGFKENNDNVTLGLIGMNRKEIL